MRWVAPERPATRSEGRWDFGCELGAPQVLRADTSGLTATCPCVGLGRACMECEPPTWPLQLPSRCPSLHASCFPRRSRRSQARLRDRPPIMLLARAVPARQSSALISHRARVEGECGERRRRGEARVAIGAPTQSHRSGTGRRLRAGPLRFVLDEKRCLLQGSSLWRSERLPGCACLESRVSPRS